jgi:hypothetical protein
MNRNIIASEILKIAKELMAIEFDTEEEKKKYQQEHEVRPGTKLTVKKDEKEISSPDQKKQKYEGAMGRLRVVKQKHGPSNRLWKKQLTEIERLIQDSFDTGNDNKKEIENQLADMHKRLGMPGGDGDVFNQLADEIQIAYTRARGY